MFEIYGEKINSTNADQVKGLIDSILKNGWAGAPILYHNSIGLITGSHRVEALRKIEEMYYNDELTDQQKKIVEKISNDEDYKLDVTRIIDDWMVDHPEESWDYDSLGKIFEGTKVEKWKNEIIEW